MTARRTTQKTLSFDHQQFDVSSLRIADTPHVSFSTAHGALFSGDCVEVLASFRSESFDTVFGDPPFNLGKTYRDKTNDRRSDAEYLSWCFRWLAECIRVLKSGGSLFVYNLPKWNVLLGAFLTQQGLEFRHWIAIEISARFPIPGRL